MNEFYTQIETQVSKEGVQTAVPFIFNDYDAALAKHYTVLSAAAKSDIPYHASCILRSDGIMVEGRVFDRRTESEEE